MAKLDRPLQSFGTRPISAVRHREDDGSTEGGGRSRSSSHQGIPVRWKHVPSSVGGLVRAFRSGGRRQPSVPQLHVHDSSTFCRRRCVDGEVQLGNQQRSHDAAHIGYCGDLCETDLTALVSRHRVIGAELFSRLSLSSRGGWGLSHTRYDQSASVTLAIDASKYR